MHHIASPDNSDTGIEREIVAKGLTAPRVTLESIEATIKSAYYFTACEGAGAAPNEMRVGDEVPLSLLTLCVLVLQNGFTVVGKSACASPANFDSDLGKRIARADAVNQVWPLEGYLLKTRLVG